MADLNPFSRVLQKHAGRAKERLLQNLGKADRTTDEDFDFHVKNFSKQQNAALRLQKEFKNYHQCLKAMQAARRSLIETVNELYEPCWMGLDQFLIKTEILNKSFDDFSEKLNDDLLLPVSTYLSQFPEYTNKISKRNRKLLDYDNCRHNLQNLETMKKREDVKITKAREQLDDARNHFEIINTELHSELPSLYNSRVTFFTSHLQHLFLSEATFHNKDSTLLTDISNILQALEEAHKNNPLPTIDDKPKNPFTEEYQPEENNASPEGHLEINPNSHECLSTKENKEDGSSSSSSCVFSTPPTTTERNLNLDMFSEMSTVEEVTEDEKSEVKDVNKRTSTHKVLHKEENSEGKDIIERTSTYKVLYKVKGTYKYVAEDVDELSFNTGDIIDVISYDDPEEQEEGWLMGVFNGKKGLFPANFTTPV